MIGRRSIGRRFGGFYAKEISSPVERNGRPLDGGQQCNKAAQQVSVLTHIHSAPTLLAGPLRHCASHSYTRPALRLMMILPRRQPHRPASNLSEGRCLVAGSWPTLSIAHLSSSRIACKTLAGFAERDSQGSIGKLSFSVAHAARRSYLLRRVEPEF